MRRGILTGVAGALALLVSRSLTATTPAEARTRSPAPEMVHIPGGRFTMGVPDAEEIRENIPENLRHLASPQHTVAIPFAFDLGKYLVTRAEFATFVSETGYAITKGCRTIVNGRTGVNSPDHDWRDPGFSQTGRDPVVCVNHADAQAYADWLTKRTGEQYRLPTEAEWEYAARAGTTTTRYWGDGRGGAQRHSNVADLSLMKQFNWTWDADGFVPWDDGFPFTSPVGSFAPNPLGLYDMLGNVWEWAADCWNLSYQGAPVDGSVWLSGDCSQRVLRGASWGNFPRAVRSGLRNRQTAGVRSSYVGFRLVRQSAAIVSEQPAGNVLTATGPQLCARERSLASRGDCGGPAFIRTTGDTSDSFHSGSVRASSGATFAPGIKRKYIAPRDARVEPAHRELVWTRYAKPIAR